MPSKVHNHHHQIPQLDDMEHEQSSSGRFFFGVLFTITELLLFSAVALFVYWVVWHDTGFSWAKNPAEQFNLHAILMIIGFIFLNGQGMLMYKLLHQCKKIYVKIIHTIIFVCSISAITVGMLTAFQGQGQKNVHFYSIHSWVGLVTVALFSLQFLVGFTSFLVLLCCDKATATFRARLLPTHVTFGLIIYSLAVITSVSGIMQMARYRLSGKEGKPKYNFNEASIILNSVGGCLIGAAILLPYIIRNCGKRK